MSAIFHFNRPLNSIFSTFILISFFSLPTSKSLASSHLFPGAPLTDGATLISSGGIFELGFFSPGSSPNRYVGIWYHNFSAATALWVANRNSPLLDTSGALAVTKDGNLAILTSQNSIIWSSKVAAFPPNESAAELLDTGNLILTNSGGQTLWQSFDHPTDTYLPGMKIGLDLVTNVNQVFTSWRSEDDPAAGNFSVGIAPDQSTQFFIWEGGNPRWRSGRWNGQVFIGIQNMVPSYIYGFRLNNFQQEKKMYFYYWQFNSSHRYVLGSDGVERHLVRANFTNNWYQYWAQPITKCGIYNHCGNNAACLDSSDGKIASCGCLKGFERDLSGDCVRRMPLHCERNNGSEPDGFYYMQGVKLPDFSEWDSGPSNDSQCEVNCWTNCSCKAYSFVTGIGCLTWGRDFVDVNLFSSGGNDFFLRLAGSEFYVHKKELKGYFIVIIVLSAVVFLIGLFLLLWKHRSRLKVFYRRRMKRQRSVVDQSRSIGYLPTGFSAVIDMHGQGKGEHNVSLFGFQTIEEATMNFSSSNLLGEGGFGPVYKGILHDGQAIAVKRLSRSSGQGMEEFKNEVILIAKLQHRNLVRLLGYCIRREDKMLVYEYMPNKSLDALFFDTRKKLQLDWKTRYSIIEGIARGLVYLHRDSRLRIIHRDLKASNILLDENMNPKISDFGMARIFGSDGNETSTKRVVGTYGYMSPEYAMNGLFSVKSDVYSFGVLLIEVVSGIRNNTYYNSEVSLNLLGYAWKLWNEDNVIELVDSSIRSSCSILEVSKCVNVGLLCIQDRANDRPAMSSVIVMLESQNSVLQMPRQPKFASEMNRSKTNLASPAEDVVGWGDSSITMLTGRSDKYFIEGVDQTITQHDEHFSSRIEMRNFGPGS